MSADDDEFGEDCDVLGIPHDWSPWEFGKMFAREERYCSLCGSMETQEIR